MAFQSNTHVAILPPDRVETVVIEEVAGILNTDIYQTRRLLSGRLPRLIAHYRSPDEAAAVADRLKTLKLSAFVCDDYLLQHPPQNSFSANSLTVTDHAIDFTTRNGSIKKVSPKDILLVIKGDKQTHTSTETTKVTRKLSISKTLIIGGFPIFDKVKQKVVTTSSETELVLRLYGRESADPAVDLYQHNMDYKFLGPKLNYSSLVNFNTMAGEIKHALPEAYFDDRLAKIKITSDATSENEFEIICRLLYLHYSAVIADQP